jgi:hypothetical protein
MNLYLAEIRNLCRNMPALLLLHDWQFHFCAPSPDSRLLPEEQVQLYTQIPDFGFCASLLIEPDLKIIDP